MNVVICKEIKKPTWIQRTKGKLKKILDDFSRFDTTYIEPNRYSWTLMTQNTNFFQRISISSHLENRTVQTLSFSPRPTFKIGPYIGWKWIFLGYGIDLNRPSSAGKATEFSLNLYTNKVGADIVYLHNEDNYRIMQTKGFKGISKKAFYKKPFNGLEANSTIVNIYYVLNHRHFSYPAAYNQSTRQRISTGSFILGARFNKNSLRFNYTKLPQVFLDPKAQETTETLAEDFKFKEFSTHDYSINFGYAYNWILAKNLLLAGSITPSMGYRKETSQRQKDNNIIKNAINYVALDLQGRAGIVWNTGKVFAGTSYITHLNGYKRKHLVVSNFINYVSIYMGVYL